MTKDDDYEELNDSNIIELKIEREEEKNAAMKIE